MEDFFAGFLGILSKTWRQQNRFQKDRFILICHRDNGHLINKLNGSTSSIKALSEDKIKMS